MVISPSRSKSIQFVDISNGCRISDRRIIVTGNRPFDNLIFRRGRMGRWRGGWRNPRRDIEKNRAALLEGQSKAVREIPGGVKEQGTLTCGCGRLQMRGFLEERRINQDHIIDARGGRDHFAEGDRLISVEINRRPDMEVLEGRLNGAWLLQGLKRFQFKDSRDGISRQVQVNQQAGTRRFPGFAGPGPSGQS